MVHIYVSFIEILQSIGRQKGIKNDFVPLLCRCYWVNVDIRDVVEMSERRGFTLVLQ